MIAEFETLQRLVQEENKEPGGEASGEPGPARGAPLAQEFSLVSSESQPCSASASASWCQGIAGASDAGLWLGRRLVPWGQGLLCRQPQKSDLRSPGCPPVSVSLSPNSTKSPSFWPIPDLPSAPTLLLSPESLGYSGPVTRTMARQLSGLIHTLVVPPGPDRTPAQASQQPREKKRRRLSPLEPDSPPAPKPGTKRQRQSLLPCLRRGSLPEARPPCGPATPPRGKVSSPRPSPRFCPATVIKSRVPLGPSALQNCSTPLALPARDLNATFDLSEEPPSKLDFHQCQGWDSVPQDLNRLDQPFISRWVSRPPSMGSEVSEGQWCHQGEQDTGLLSESGHCTSCLWSGRHPGPDEQNLHFLWTHCFSQGPCLPVCMLKLPALCSFVTCSQ